MRIFAGLWRRFFAKPYRTSEADTHGGGVVYTLVLPAKNPNQPSGQSCSNCRFFIDYSDTEPIDEVNGYCSHPSHSSPLSEHRDYGGHWTHTEAWCDKWTPTSGEA